MQTPPASTAYGSDSPNERTEKLRAFVARVDVRVQDYLDQRPDGLEQRDHMRHVADRTRWLYYSELNREKPGASVIISRHEDSLIEACVLSHDIGKWIPREELQALVPDEASTLDPLFQELRLTANQRDLFLLGVRRRLALKHDGYVPEYDSAHHLVSAFMLAADDDFGFHALNALDRGRLTDMIVGHQFGSYFKESLFHLSVEDDEVTTGMLLEISSPGRAMGDLLASSFHDADISDLLFVGSLERRPHREEIFHTGGLVKILMINFTNLIYGAPHGPRTLTACLRSCNGTVNSACKEFITPTAVRHGSKWRRQARRFLATFKDRIVVEKLNNALFDDSRPLSERLLTVRTLTHMQARSFLKTDFDAG